MYWVSRILGLMWGVTWKCCVPWRVFNGSHSKQLLLVSCCSMERTVPWFESSDLKFSPFFILIKFLWINIFSESRKVLIKSIKMWITISRSRRWLRCNRNISIVGRLSSILRRIGRRSIFRISAKGKVPKSKYNLTFN